MNNALPPIVKDGYTDLERALIAGYLVRKRTGTIKALRAVGSAKRESTEGWAEGSFRYYADAERYSRFLLYYIGYPVAKGLNYGEEPTGA